MITPRTYYWSIESVVYHISCICGTYYLTDYSTVCLRRHFLYQYTHWYQRLDRHFLVWKCLYFYAFFPVFKGPISKKKALDYMMAWHWTGDKPLSKPMLGYFMTDIYTCICACLIPYCIVNLYMCGKSTGLLVSSLLVDKIGWPHKKLAGEIRYVTALEGRCIPSSARIYGTWPRSINYYIWPIYYPTLADGTSSA